MTVQELINRLTTFDAALDVVMTGESCDLVEVDGAFEDLVAASPDGLQLADERDVDRLKVVRLFPPDD